MNLLIQLLDQGIIAAFEAYYLRKSFKGILESIKINSEATVKHFGKNNNIVYCIPEIDALWLKISESSVNGCR